jgi:hypothetical protein
MAENHLRAVAFPKLDEAQIASLGRCPLTELKRYRAGEKLFEVGQCDCKFFVIKSGEATRKGSIIVVHHGGVHRRRGAADRQPGPAQRRRPD